jgi:agmatine deiminase
MISDRQKNVVYVTESLKTRLPRLHNELAEILATHQVPLKHLGNCADIWARDFMPVQISPANYVKFRYAPEYLEGYEHLMTPESVALAPACIGTARRSNIVLDGGNVVTGSDRVMITGRVLWENKKIRKAKLLEEVEELLVTKVDLLPENEDEVICHADGMARFVDDSHIVVSDFTTVFPFYHKKLVNFFEKRGYDITFMPYFSDGVVIDEIPSAVGLYVNYLQVGSLIVFPIFGCPTDDVALSQMAKAYPSAKIVPMLCNDLALQGGVLNCITWTTCE